MRINKVHRLSILLLLSLAISLCAQKANYVNYNESNGLPSNEAYFVFQDHEGFVWMSTDNGAVRYDGHDFMLYNKQNGMADNVNFGIYSDSKHRLWFRSYSGAISIYDKGKIIRHPLNKVIQELLGKALMLSMAIDRNDWVYLPTNSGILLRVDTSTTYSADTIPKTTLAIKSVDGADPIVFHSYTISEVEHLMFNDKMLPRIQYHKPMRSGIAGAKEFRGKTYFFIDSYLFEINENGYKKVLETERPVISLSTDRNGKMWVGLQSGGLYYFDGKKFQRPGQFVNLENLSVTSVLQDDNSCFWISTLEKGVFYYPNLSIVTYQFPFKSKVGAVSFGNNNAYFGNYDGSLYSFNPGSGSFNLIEQFESSINALAYVSTEGNLFVGGTSATYVLNTETRNIKQMNLMGIPIWGIKKFQETETEVIGANSNRFLIFNKNGDFKSFKDSPLKARSFLIDSDRVFVAPISGLVKTDFNLESYDTLPELINNKVLDISATPRRVFAATAESGLLEWKEDSFKPYYDADVFSCPLVRMIHFDGSKIYLATECGLVIDDIEAKQNEQSITILNAGNGLLNTSTNYVGFVDKWLVCFSADGISVIDAGSPIPENKIKFYLKATRVNNNNTWVSPALSSEENNLEFDYGFISFNNRDIRVRHRPSPKFAWSDGNVSKVNYYSLSPGNYEPELSYSVAGGPWQFVKLSSPFRIMPPWWETAYFRILAIVLLIVIVALVFYSVYQKRVAEMKFQDGLRHEKDRISRELHDNIGSKLAYIKFSLSSLNSVNDFQDKKDQIEVEISSAVDELRDTIWAINKEEVTVSDFVDRVRLMLSRLNLLGRLIEFTFVNNAASHTATMDPGVAVELFRIIQEAVNNSIKHSGGNKIMVELSLEPRSDLFISIKDNGVGFNNGHLVGKDGYGLLSMKRRADKLGANFKLNSSPDVGTEINVIYRLTA